jgi:methanethiol S-methyltransferase
METLRRIGALSYGAACYAIFFATFLYLIAFLANAPLIPKSIDSGTADGFGVALALDLFVLVLFGLQHSVMARPGFKEWITRVVPHSLERSTYVLASSAVLILLFLVWQPMPQVVFGFESVGARAALVGLNLLGYGIVLYSTFLIDHFDLFGLRQVFLRAIGRTYTEKRFATPTLYRLIRHPIYVGWILAFWAMPTYTVGHMLFAAVMTGYILFAIPLEERDLSAQLGKPYDEWRARTPAFVPRLGRSRTPSAKVAGEA